MEIKNGKYSKEEIKEALKWFQDTLIELHTGTIGKEIASKDQYEVTVDKEESKYLDVLSMTTVYFDENGENRGYDLFNRVGGADKGESALYFNKAITPRMIDKIFAHFGL